LIQNLVETMDATERQKIEVLLKELEDAPRTGKESLGELEWVHVQMNRYQQQISNFIPEVMQVDSELVWDLWRQVAAELNQVGNSSSSHISPRVLPEVIRTQSDRFRLEQMSCLLIRQPLFSAYEGVIFQRTTQSFALTGPQGFGKSAFLHYLATKYCHNKGFLVAFVPVCPSETNHLKKAIAAAFYRGCRIAELTEYKELTCLDDLGMMLEKCAGFASSKGKMLLLVIDQMKYRNQAFFDATTREISSVAAYVNAGIKVVLSSSTSLAWASVFSDGYWPLERYHHRLTSTEATLLATHFQNIASDKLVDEPFQVVAEKLSGKAPSIAKARAMAQEILNNPNDAGQMQVFFCLQLVADGTTKSTEEEFAIAAVLDTDYFYILKDGNCFYIAEHRKGFAESVLAIMRSHPGDYETYLTAVLSNTNFDQLDQGAKGRIVEDCFFSILRGRSEVEFPFRKMNGTNTKPASVTLEDGQTTVVDVPGGDDSVLGRDEVNWPVGAQNHVFVFIPLHRQYKGIDFIVAKKTARTLYIYFVQCTVQLPQNYPIGESTLYLRWAQELTASAGDVTCHSYLVFLTPHSTKLSSPGPASLDKFFRDKTHLHVRFAAIRGSNSLLEKIRDRFGNF